jgi:ribosomal protein S18 acetylase RimI-like enzyme
LVSSIFQVHLVHSGLGGILLSEEPVSNPSLKDYDNTTDGCPLEWRNQFDVQNWGLFMAVDNQIPIAGAAVAFNTNGVNLLEERKDLSVLWDIRVKPEKRGQGIGKTLFQYALNWSANHGCRQMKIETQNNNVPASRFYQYLGCNLGVIHRFAYANDPKLTHEVMLNWFINIQ